MDYLFYKYVVDLKQTEPEKEKTDRNKKTFFTNFLSVLANAGLKPFNLGSYREY